MIMEFTKRVEKYIELSDRMMNISDEVAFFDGYVGYNPEKRDRASKRLEKTEAMLERLTSKLRPDEMEMIEGHYGIEIFEEE